MTLKTAKIIGYDKHRMNKNTKEGKQLNVNH